jgi:capsular exopolysaccharide synthesis family protein
MSRNYDALLQASRTAEPGELDTPVLPAAAADATVCSPVDVAAGAPSPAGEDPAPAPEPLIQREPDVWSAHLPDTTLAHATEFARGILDKAAPLIPNVSDSVVVEHYRRLRTKVMQAHAAAPFRTLVIASANPKEGKTVTVMNLALVFSMLPRFRVLVVDCDLRLQSLSGWVGLRGAPGFTNFIDGTADTSAAIHKCGDLPLSIMPAGTSEVPAAELLHSGRLSSKLAEMSAAFDLVLIDTPPVNLLTDAQVLAEHCDAVLLVVRAFAATQKAVEKAAAEIARFRVIGCVLNGGPNTKIGSYGYGAYGGYYETSSKKGKK